MIALVVLGAAYFSGPVFVFLLTLMVVLQVAVLGCPVMWLTGQLRQVHDPDYEIKWSFTAWLYHEYGAGSASPCSASSVGSPSPSASGSSPERVPDRTLAALRLAVPCPEARKAHRAWRAHDPITPRERDR